MGGFILSTYKTPDRGQFVSFDPKDSNGDFDYDSSSSTELDDSGSESDTSTLLWTDAEQLQLGEYVLE